VVHFSMLKRYTFRLTKTTIFQAYKAMYEYLRMYYYHMNKPEEIGNLLSEMQLIKNKRPVDIDTNDGTPVDPAAWEEWISAINIVIEAERKKD
jgi:hypothetical protein